ncbi:hypothetical protein [Rhizobium mongolense]|uniref:Uncharacterized protein n=1 Tax=Rhizobium mongolense TaxID=57676 RepID=A0A7W6WGL6_9HYPH|nr:hypothetical protein [Rhizobium mongolense]MBB4276904.1 hypothetical protein [Rhizobium mongolense]
MSACTPEERKSAGEGNQATQSINSLRYVTCRGAKWHERDYVSKADRSLHDHGLSHSLKEPRKKYCGKQSEDRQYQQDESGTRERKRSKNLPFAKRHEYSQREKEQKKIWNQDRRSHGEREGRGRAECRRQHHPCERIFDGGEHQDCPHHNSYQPKKFDPHPPHLAS